MLNNNKLKQYFRKEAGLLDGDTLGQVSGLVHVETTSNCNVVGEQLEGDDVDDSLQAVNGCRDSEEGIGTLVEAGVSLGAHDDWVTLASCDLVDGVLHLVEGTILGGNHDDGHELINESKGTVLQLTGQDTLRVHV